MIVSAVVLLAISACGFVHPASGYVVKPVQISLLSPQGLRFAYPDETGVTLVAFHYNINKELKGVKAGDYNYDVTSTTGEYWIHDNVDVNVQIGDVVYYWVYVMYQGLGYQELELSWTPPEPTPAPNPPTTNPPATNPPATNPPATNPPATNPPATNPPATNPPATNPPATNTPAATSAPGNGSLPDQCNMYPCDSSCDMTSAPCNGLILEEEFDTFNLDLWEHEITAGGGGNWEFQYYTNNRSNSYVRDGVLYLKPTLTTETHGDGFLESGSLNLWGASPANLCTGNAWWGCERSGNPSNILNPIQSARVRTVNSFSFKYGRLEVEAKMPTGDWIWPAIWLLPKHHAYGEWPASGEIDLVECRGNADLEDDSQNSVGIDQMGSTMHWGPFWPYNGYPKTHATKTLTGGQTFGSGFHKYELDWTPDSLTFKVDGDTVLVVDPTTAGYTGFWDWGNFATDAPGINNPWAYNANKLTPFDQEFYLILNVAVGGTNFFSDGFTNKAYSKPWLNSSPTAAKDFWDARANWMPTWNMDVNNGEDSAMQVNYIRVYANEGQTTYHKRDR